MNVVKKRIEQGLGRMDRLAGKLFPVENLGAEAPVGTRILVRESGSHFVKVQGGWRYADEKEVWSIDSPWPWGVAVLALEAAAAGKIMPGFRLVNDASLGHRVTSDPKGESQ